MVSIEEQKMTGYTVHTGASKKFVAGWDRIFKSESDGTKKKAAGKKSSGRKPAKKK